MTDIQFIPYDLYENSKIQITTAGILRGSVVHHHALS